MFDKALLRLPSIKHLLRLLGGFYFFQAIFVVSQAICLSAAVVNLWQGKPVVHQIGLMSGFALSFLARQAITFVSENYLDGFARKNALRLRLKLVDHIFQTGLQSLAQGAGSLVTLAQSGIDQVKQYIALVLSKTLNLSIVPWVLLASIAYFDWISAVILGLMYPLVILFMVVLGYAAKAKADRQFDSYQLLSNHFLDSLLGLATLRFLGISQKYAKSIYKTSERFRQATLSTLKIAMLSTFALDFFTTLSIAVVAVFLGLRLLDGTINLFPALVVLILAPDYFLPLRNFASDYHATLDGKNAFNKINQVLMKTPPASLNRALPQWTAKSQLTLSHVTMKYENGNPTHDAGIFDVNLTLSGTKKIGIIGMSGAGKSTLVNVLTGFLQPQSGTINYAKTTLPHLHDASWQKQIAYIPQKPYLFAASLRDNLAFYAPDASDEKIKQAVAAVGLSDVVASLPAGLNTQIGSGARQFSGGQAQRIALARALLDDTRKIWVFDEPTAHLDLQTEIALKKQMLPLMKNRLVLFATHRLHWLAQMDEIIVLDEGKVVQHKTFAELALQGGKFAELIGNQKG